MHPVILTEEERLAVLAAIHREETRAQRSRDRITHRYPTSATPDLDTKLRLLSAAKTKLSRARKDT